MYIFFLHHCIQKVENQLPIQIEIHFGSPNHGVVQFPYANFQAYQIQSFPYQHKKVPNPHDLNLPSPQASFFVLYSVRYIRGPHLLFDFNFNYLEFKIK